jgi:hypothetical protein
MSSGDEALLEQRALAAVAQQGAEPEARDDEFRRKKAHKKAQDKKGLITWAIRAVEEILAPLTSHRSASGYAIPVT